MKYKFPERLKELRQEKGLSQKQLSLELEEKFSDVAIYLWEQNKRIPNLQAVMILAEYFGVSVDYLAGLED